MPTSFVLIVCLFACFRFRKALISLQDMGRSVKNGYILTMALFYQYF